MVVVVLKDRVKPPTNPTLDPWGSIKMIVIFVGEGTSRHVDYLMNRLQLVYIAIPVINLTHFLTSLNVVVLYFIK